MFNKVKRFDAISLNFFTSLTILELESNGGIISTTKVNSFLYFRKFSTFAVSLIVYLLLKQGLSHKDIPVVIAIEICNRIISVSK